MKLTKNLGQAGRCFAGLVCGWLLTSAAAAEGVSAVTRKGDQMLVVQNGKSAPMTAAVTLPHDIKVMTNGTFTVKGGVVRELRDGDSLGADGMLMRRNGQVEPVFDHITRRKGTVVIVRDGQSQPLKQPFKLPDGSQVLPNATIREPNGGLRQLLDGQLLALTGTTIAVKDTISLLNGKVVVQKDGSLLNVPQGRSLMMNDGTKVFGDGTVVRPDGSKFKLSEGQTVTIEGVTN
jgi:hypothetical protein